MSAFVNQTDDYLAVAAHIAAELAKDAVQRDKAGGTPRAQLQLLRESGLLSLLIPEKFGGQGQPWSALLRVVRELAKVDASIAHIFGFHFTSVVAPYYRGTKEQSEHYYSETINHNWFWGNAVNTKDKRLFGKKSGENYILNGVKAFASGSPGSDHLIITWRDEQNGALFYGAIPTNRVGVTVNEDWDGIGQRQTGSGTVEFKDVIVKPHEILRSDISGGYAFLISQLLPLSILTNVFIGSTQGVIEEAKKYSLAKYHTDSGIDQTAIDPLISRRYGDLWIKSRGATSLVDEAATLLDQAWEKDFNLTKFEFDKLSSETISANVLAGNVALYVTSDIFEVMGARSATTKYGFDRFWRNVRTHTLHDSVENKLKNVGTWVLTDEFPAATPTK